MKKQMIKIVAVIALIATAGWNITQSEKEGALSDLALENIDALAQGEVDIEFICVGTSGICHQYDDKFGNETLKGEKITQ